MTSSGGEEVPYFSTEWSRTAFWVIMPIGPRGLGRGLEELGDAGKGLRWMGGGEEAGHLVRHHIATNKNWIRDPQWSKYFQELFARAGMSLEDPANLVELPAEFHKGPHSQAYHQWVYQRLQGAIAGLKDPAQIRARLEAVLRAIAEELKAHPEYLINPPMGGGR